MRGKVVVITGATSGIGEVAAEALAAKGARIVFVARDAARAERTLERLRRAGGDAEHRFHLADLMEIAEMKRVGAEIAAAEPRIDVLMNNAGAMFRSRGVTPEGLERTFALNHMSYFVLTHYLHPCVVAAAPSRIVNTASRAHVGRSLDFDDLQNAKNYSYGNSYGRSKLCNILFTRELARRLADTGVTANCVHPGFVQTRFGQGDGGGFAVLVRLAMAVAGRNVNKGAETLIYLASAPDVSATGKYFADCHEALPSRQAQDDVAARRLWDESARIAGL